MPVCYLKQKRMINKQLITRRFTRAVESYNREAVAQKDVYKRQLWKRMAWIMPTVLCVCPS